jgi:hypothetical protein
MHSSSGNIDDNTRLRNEKYLNEFSNYAWIKILIDKRVFGNMEQTLNANFYDALFYLSMHYNEP